MIRVVAALILVTLAGCEPPEPRTIVDQCLRTELFERCMRALPAGPALTRYNDWDEVVSECGIQAYHQALRLRENVKKECRA